MKTLGCRRRKSFRIPGMVSSPTLPTEGLGLIFQPLRNDVLCCGGAELEGISDVSAVTSFRAVGV